MDTNEILYQKETALKQQSALWLPKGKGGGQRK